MLADDNTSPHARPTKGYHLEHHLLLMAKALLIANSNSRLYTPQGTAMKLGTSTRLITRRLPAGAMKKKANNAANKSPPTKETKNAAIAGDRIPVWMVNTRNTIG